MSVKRDLRFERALLKRPWLVVLSAGILIITLRFILVFAYAEEAFGGDASHLTAGIMLLLVGSIVSFIGTPLVAVVTRFQRRRPR